MLMVLLNTIGRHKTPPDPSDLWTWALAWVAPPLTAIFGCFAFTAIHPPSRRLAVDLFFYRSVLAISAFEVLILLALLSLEPFDGAFDVATFARATKGWAAGGQGLFAIAVGGIFFKGRPTRKTGGHSPLKRQWPP
jgi:hypothetical protein